MNSYNLILIFGGSLIVFMLLMSILWFSGLLLPFFYKGAPYVPTSKKISKQMVALAKIVPTDHVADFGSGDGRLLVEAVRAGATIAEGYEIHPGLVWYSRLITRLTKTNEHIKIHQGSFWNADLSNITVLFLYQLPDSMKTLSQKLRNDLPEGARIISHSFPLEDWQPIKRESDVFVYTKKSLNSFRDKPQST